MNLNHKTNFENGDQLNAQDWNRLAADVNELGTNSTNGAGSGNSVADTHISLSSKGNVEFTTTEADLNAKGKGGKINIESYSDIQLKPGDDVVFTSSHRPVKNMDEITMKIHDGEDHPVKLQLNTAEIVLTAKDKNLTMTKDENGKDTTTAMYDDPNVMNVTVNSDKNTRGYLKVRAQAIDLRSESHGGIALQPKGYDSDGHMNKIKFEHGGGDGLEFGTFNAEKTSIFTDEYRFNKDGKWLASTRQKIYSDKMDGQVQIKYLGMGTPQENYLTYTGGRSYTVFSGNLQLNQLYTISQVIASCDLSELPFQKFIVSVPNNGYFVIHETIYDDDLGGYDTLATHQFQVLININDFTTAYKYVKQPDDFYDIVNSSIDCTTEDIIKTANALNGLPSIETKIDGKKLSISSSDKYVAGFRNGYDSDHTYDYGVSETDLVGIDINVGEFKEYTLSELTSAFPFISNFSFNRGLDDTINAGVPTRSIVFSCQKYEGSDIIISAGGKLKLKGELDFGDTFNFGETEDGIEVQYKFTKKGNTKDCGTLKVIGVNNHETDSFTVEGITVAPGESTTITSCSILDIIKLTNYMKQNNQGPWAS